MPISQLAAEFIQGDYGHTSGSQSQVDRVVMHATVSATVAGGARGNASYFQSPNAGGLAHYTVDMNEIIACCDESIVAWQSPPNQNSIGIELCDPQGETGIQANAADPGRWQDSDHQQMLVLGARLAADVCARWGVPTVRIGAQDLLNGARGICGHGDVSAAWRQSDHTDPDVAGPFPWDQFIALVNGHSSQPTVPTNTDPTRIVVGSDVEESLVKPYFIHSPLDGKGNGYVDLQGIAAKSIVSIVANDANPPQNGYITPPLFGRLDVSRGPTSPVTRVVIHGGYPGGAIDFVVWAA